ncbi:MAG: OmpA family protein [Candidatus Kapaibacterium sp.]
MRYLLLGFVFANLLLMSTCSQPQRASWSDFISKHPEVIEYEGKDDSLGMAMNPPPDTMKLHKEDSLYFGISPGKTMVYTAQSPQSLILPEDARDFLDRSAQYLNRFPESKIKIVGHTDNTGTPEDIEQRASMRAAAAVTYLNSKGINMERIESTGVGDSNPVADNRYEGGRKLNNRLEITVIGSK